MGRLTLLVALTLISWLLVLALRQWIAARRLLDVPNERSSHSRPTPRGGGLVIVVVTVLSGLWLLRDRQVWPQLPAYLFGGALIAAISWLDDLRSVANRIRFACHLLGALLVVLTLRALPPVAGISLPWWLIAPALLIWIVALTNMYNFMDGIDGIATGQAVVAALWWFLVGLQLEVRPLSLLALALTAAALGFLAHNWSPARIFMGDVGSAFLGYSFAVFPLLAVQARGDWSLLAGGVLVVWPFIFDATLTIARRARAGENIFRAHRSHLYQRLTICGWTHRAVSTLYLGYAAICALCATVVLAGGWGVVAVPAVLGLLLFWFVSRVERRHARSLPGYSVPGHG